MTDTKYSLTTKIDGVGVHYFKVGYPECPEIMLLPYDISSLNKETIDWKNLKLKDISSKIEMNPTGEAVEWYVDDLKKATTTITVRTSSTVFETGATIVAGETLYNRTTGKTYVVTSVTGAAVTINAADAATAVGDVIVRTGFSKLYGQDSSFTSGRNDLSEYSNYVQYAEFDIQIDMIETNKTRLFIKTDKEYIENRIADASRDAVLNAIYGFYVGTKAKISSGGTYRYTAGGLDYFIPNGYKVNIKGVDNAATKANIRTQLEIAYGSGVTNIYAANNLVFFCNAKMASVFDDLYEEKMVINDTLTSIDVNIKTINLGGRKLRVVESSTLNVLFDDVAIGYLYPLQDTFLYNVPSRVLDDNGKLLQNGFGIMYKKPLTSLEKSTHALATTFSFVFGTAGTGAYQRWTYA